MTRRVSTVAAIFFVANVAAGPSAMAQPSLRPYIGGSVGHFSVNADEVDGGSVAAGLFGGMAFSKYVDAELEVVFPADPFTRSYAGTSVSFASPGSSRAERERFSVVTRFDKARDVGASASAVVVIHPVAGRRWTPGLIVGVTNQRVRDHATYTPISIPAGVDPQHPSIIARTESSSRNIGGPTIGANLAIAVTAHLSIVPDVRYDYGSIGDEINNALRTSVRIRWRF